MKDERHIKDFYASHADRITSKREESPHLLRRYVHKQQYASIAEYVEPGMSVLDDGCGEGALSFILAEKGAQVVGCDISAPNIRVCKEKKKNKDQSNRTTFVVADSERLPFPDNSFDLVVSSHVLEHLPDFDKGLQEIMRVTKKRAVIAIPTAFSPCSWVQVGQGWFYLKGLRSFFALLWGFLRVLGALIVGAEGVNEMYGGVDVPHVFRFPWVMRRKLRKMGVRLITQEADSLCFPYFNSLLPLIRWLNARRERWPWRNLGYGTVYVAEK